MELFNIGCGLQAPAGWHNLDRSPNLILDRIRPVKWALHKVGVLTEAHMAEWPRNIRLHDIRMGLPCEEGQAEGIYSSHMLEHMYLDEARNVIRCCYRALRPGAVFRVALPNGQAIAARGAEGTVEGALAYNEQLLAHPLSRPSYRQRVVGLFRSPPHRWQPSPALVLHFFREAGFANPEERKFMESNLPEIERVETRPNSFFVEAVK